MKLAKQLEASLDEALHFNTKVRALEGMGSRKIRLAVKEAKRMVEQMMDPKSQTPNPKDEESMRLLSDAKFLLNQSETRLKQVREKKYKGSK